MILLKVRLLQSGYFLLSFFILFKHYFANYPRMNLADKVYLVLYLVKDIASWCRPIRILFYFLDSRKKLRIEEIARLQEEDPDAEIDIEVEQCRYALVFFVSSRNKISFPKYPQYHCGHFSNVTIFAYRSSVNLFCCNILTTLWLFLDGLK